MIGPEIKSCTFAQIKTYFCIFHKEYIHNFLSTRSLQSNDKIHLCDISNDITSSEEQYHSKHIYYTSYPILNIKMFTIDDFIQYKTCGTETSMRTEIIHNM